METAMRIVDRAQRAAVVLMTIVLLAGGGNAGSASGAEPSASKSKMSAAEVTKKRDAVRKIRDDALEDFYATKPEIKEEVAKAVGYAVFDASQVNILLFVGGLGEGVLVENGTGKETFMTMKRAGTGPGVGYKSFRQLMVFKDRSLFDNFRKLGADIGASADATMKIGGKGVAVDPNVSFNPLLSIYQITDRGALLQANWGGVAYAPDAGLNQ
jgi:lipid-binding SYLF domain-containing protein